MFNANWMSAISSAHPLRLPAQLRPPLPSSSICILTPPSNTYSHLHTLCVDQLKLPSPPHARSLHGRRAPLPPLASVIALSLPLE